MSRLPTSPVDRESSIDTALPPTYSPSGDPPSHEESLQDAAMAIPDSDALSVSSSLQTTAPEHMTDEQIALQGSENDTSHRLDWGHMLGLSGQSLNAATTATSFGFAAARTSTSFGINLAKRITQGLIALPAMAIDGAVTGSAPGSGSNTPTISQAAHAAVGGIFDIISTLALGGIDVGSAITGASLGAAASGVEGVRRALGSEVLKSLGAFSRLVKREWNSASDTLPPGGIPGYSVLGITQALTAWVCIQMVTREYYEVRMLRHLEPIDLQELHRSIQVEREDEKRRETQASQGDQEAKIEGKRKDAHRQDTPGATSTKVNRKQKKQVRILEEQTLPDGEGDLIGAEIGHREEPVAPSFDTPAESSTSNVTSSHETAASSTTPTTTLPQPLTNQQAILGLKRYSKLVLGVYGGVALAWLGSLPPDLMQAAGSVVDGGAPTVTQTRQEEVLLGSTGIRGPTNDDEADFLKAAASLDLDDGELIEDEMEDDGILVEVNGTPSPSGMPGGFNYIAKKGVKQPSTASTNLVTPPVGQVLFSADPDVMPAPQDSRVTSANTVAPPVTTTTNAVGATPTRQGSSYSYIDLLTGQADADIFHRLGGLEDGAALEGNYDETSSQAGSGTAAQRLERATRRVARPSRPRYYVVTDHANKKIILVLRGSLTLGDIAIDLTCESANFEFEGDSKTDVQVDSEQAAYPADDEEGPEPAQDFSPEAIREREAKAMAEVQEKQTEPQARPHVRGEYIVHEGMYETAKEIGEVGRPVHRAVRKALLKNPNYNLDITGHSLGAGVAALLAIMWATPETCLTTKHSGLPSGRRTHAFCFAVPCVMGNQLAKRAERLVTSYCHSYDLICRLSLGAILDIRNACAWLAYENALQNIPATRGEEGGPGASSSTSTSGLTHPIRMTNVMQRAFQHQSGQMNNNLRAKNELEADFLALRKSLEANMRQVELYPPGVVLYSLAKEDLTPTLLRDSDSNRTSKDHYLYRLNDEASRDEVFGQIIFSRGMLSKHMPHIYHDALDAM
ncbi:hypothetical protein CBS101457_003905 [Exobasidium rhododendri]|nr:hypothetical protein CBS101457_003905 [Exobasidium rhododendri]